MSSNNQLLLDKDVLTLDESSLARRKRRQPPDMTIGAPIDVLILTRLGYASANFLSGSKKPCDGRQPKQRIV
jgi:hypothetical protein